MDNVVQHPSFSGTAVVNERHHGIYPKKVTSLRVYRRGRRNQPDMVSGEMLEQQIAEMNRVLAEVSHHLVLAALAIA